MNDSRVREEEGGGGGSHDMIIINTMCVCGCVKIFYDEDVCGSRPLVLFCT